jgi:6-phosphogluconolactonase
VPRPDRLEVVADAAALAAATADAFTRQAVEAVRARGRFVVALAGGSTPKAAYRLLADPSGPWRAQVDWGRVEVFFGDERFVPAEHPDSNYRMAREALLAHVPVAGVHRVPTELASADEAAREYARELARVTGEGIADQSTPPRLDLVLLGMGADGHTASLFPGTTALAETRRWVAAPWVEKLATHRVTFTYPVLAQARRVVFAVGGADKRPALEQVLAAAPGEGPPAARVRPGDGELVWLVDAAAAGA